VRHKSLVPFAEEETLGKMCLRARLLNWVEQEGRRASKVAGQFTVNADKVGRAIGGMRVLAICQLGAVELV
jgi:hypothetical protein